MLGTLWWWSTIYDQVPRLELPWFTAFSVLRLKALAGCLMYVRFNWRAAKFPLALIVVFAFAWEFFPFFFGPFHRNVSPITPLSAWVNAAFYLVGVGGSLYLLRKTAPTPLSKTILFASAFTALILSTRAMNLLGILLIDAPHFAWGSFFSALPLPVLLFCLRAASMKNEIFEEYKRPLAYSTGAILALQAWSFLESFSSAGVAVLHVFIPILNLLELQQAAFLVALVLWLQIFAFGDRPLGKWSRQAHWSIAVLFFLWINQVAARATFWYWYAPPYDPWKMFLTPECQAVIAILWGAIGLWAILRGQKIHSRALWCAGAGLLAVDMLKLLLVDLRGAETLTRVLAFLVLGGLFMLIGWIAPLPPKKEAS